MSTRRQFLATVAAVPITATLATGDRGTIRPFSIPDNAIRHSGNRLSWVLTADGEDALEDLEDSLESLDDVRWIDSRTHEATGRATIVASPRDMGVRQRDRLSSRGILSNYSNLLEHVELNRRLSMARPLSPEGSSAWESPGRTTQGLLSTVGSGSLSSTGVAFEGNMDEATLRDVRQQVDADSTSVDVDTSSLTIAVIDTGVNDGTAIPEDRLLEESKDFTDGDETGSTAAEDGDGHGSWVASCLASSAGGSFEGFAPDADVLALKALDDNGAGEIDNIAAAITYAADEGADVICLSLGSPQFSQAIEDALEYAASQGSIPVAAAGNDRQATRWVAYPASSQWTVAVGATTAHEPEDARSAYYSNVGPHNGITDLSEGQTAGREIDIGAPGCEITAMVPRRRGSDREQTLTGTSMAAPVAAGVIALRLADGGPTDFDDVVADLQASAEPIEQAAESEVGAGMANAQNLLEGHEPDDDQADVMSDDASARDAAYRSLSGSTWGRAWLNVNQTVGW